MRSKYFIENGLRAGLLMSTLAGGLGCSAETADSSDEPIHEAISAFTMIQRNGSITSNLRPGGVFGNDTVFSTLLQDPLNFAGDSLTRGSVSFFTILPDIPTNFVKVDASGRAESVQTDPGIAPGFPAAWRAMTANQYARIRYNWTNTPLPGSPNLRPLNSWGWRISNDLMSKHSGCSQIEKFRHPDCVSAIRRVCVDQGYNAGFGQAATGVSAIQSGCFNAPSITTVTEAVLRTHHAGCRRLDSQSPECMAATHRYCGTLGFNAGFALDTPPNGVEVACVNAGRYGDVSMTTLQSFHPSCQRTASQSFQCLTAAHRYCMTKGFLGGISQEVGTSALGIACFTIVPSTFDDFMINI
jgi:hypothetical protein